MADYQENKGNLGLLNAIAFLGIKFPVAEIVRKTGYSKSVVSTYLKENANPSNEFLRKFEECFSVSLQDFEPLDENIVSEKTSEYSKNLFTNEINQINSKIKEHKKIIQLSKNEKTNEYHREMINLLNIQLEILLAEEKDYRDSF